MVRKFYPPIQTPRSTILFYGVSLSMIGIHSVANDKSFVLREVVIIRCVWCWWERRWSLVWLILLFLLLLKVLAYKQEEMYDSQNIASALQKPFVRWKNLLS